MQIYIKIRRLLYWQNKTNGRRDDFSFHLSILNHILNNLMDFLWSYIYGVSIFLSIEKTTTARVGIVFLYLNRHFAGSPY